MLRKSLKRVQDVGTQPTSLDVKIQKQSFHQEVPLGMPCADDSERVLETLVLGCDQDVVENISKSLEKEKQKDRKSKRRQHVHEVLKKQKNPVWEDEDDKQISIQYTKNKKAKVKRNEELITGEEYEKKLQSEFEKVTSTPNWAKLKYEREEEASSDDSDVEELMKSTGNYLITSSSLPRDILQIKRCTDINKDSTSTSKIKAVEFHPSAQVALTGGLDQRLCFYQIDGKNNPEIQSVFIDGFPIYAAHFSTDGQEAIVSSKLKAFYYYDMVAVKIVNVPWMKACEETNMRFFEVSPDGKFIVFRGEHGRMHLLSSKTKELIHTLKMNGSCHSISFTKDGKTMYSYGDDGDVYVWDLNSRSCVHKFVDEGCLHGQVVRVSDNNQYLACGSDSGVVNIYDVQTCLTSDRPKPLKAIMNLTTPCTYAKFNSKTEVLAIASNYMEKGVKFVHLPSFTVFSNFPNQKVDREIRIPLCLDFSLNSGYFTVANNAGKALLYRLKHYGNY